MDTRRISQLTETSKELVSFIQTHNATPFRLSKISKMYLSKLCRLIHHSFVHMPLYTVTDMKPTMESFITEFTSTPEGKHIPAQILDKIKHSPKIGRQVELKIHGRYIHLYFVLPTPTLDFSLDKLNPDAFFDTCIRRAIVWLDVALRFSGKQCANELNCYFFFTDDKKHLPPFRKKASKMHIQIPGGMGDNDPTISQKHANTAFTWACVPSSKIVLFRFEEWLKVFVHESFHCFGLDFAQMDSNTPSLSRLFPICKKGMDFRIYETYCETWAETINALFVSYYTCIGKPESQTKKRRPNTRRTKKRRPNTRHTLHLSKILKGVEEIIQNERTFSIFQLVKVLRHHHLTYSEIYCVSESPCVDTLEKRNTYSEDTQVFSYYIVKPILMYYLNEYIEWCYKHNERDNTLYFVKTRDNIEQYITLVAKLLTMSEFKHAVQEEESTYSRNMSKTIPHHGTSSTAKRQNRAKRPNFFTTLRMSLYELAS